MSFTMPYDERNRKELAKLGDKTKALAMKWYQYLIDNKIEVLITETKRTEAQQRENVKKGVSETMRSYHLVGQALDFVPSKGKSIDYGRYGEEKYKKAIAYAKKLGFTWGGDWTSLVDKPHLQNDTIPYGTDTFTGKTVSVAATSATKSYLEKGDRGSKVKELQTKLNKAGYKLAIDSIFGKDTESAVRKFQKAQGLSVDGLAGVKTIAKLDSVIKSKSKSSGIKSVGTIKIHGTKSGRCYICDKPSQKSKNIGTAKEGSTLHIAGSVKGWYEVIFNGSRAYVSAKFAKRV